MTVSRLRRAPARRSITHAHAPSPRTTLGLILACYLMIILDVSVIITALPEIRTTLGFSDAGLSWVQNAYTLAFGGLLLLGARAGDLLGRRRAFMGGIALFAAASLAAGLAQSAAWLLVARAVQGAGAAVAAPSTLALLTTTFREGAERARALRLYSAVAAGGGSVGLVVGGMLTAWASWRWAMLLNVPLGLTLIALAPRHLPETETRHGRFDLLGAATSTLGMTALVYGFVRAASAGWGDGGTVASFTAGVVLLAAFVAHERRAAQPITPLRLFASRERSGAYAARVLLVGGLFSSFFFITQDFQGVLGYSSLQAGLAFLPMTLVMFAVTQLIPRVAPAVDGSKLLVGGIVVALAGMAWLSRISAATELWPGIALPLVLLGTGMGVALAPLTAAGIAGVSDADAGAASGLVNVSHQLGGSLGLGILVTVFAGAGHGEAGAARGMSPETLGHAVGEALTGATVLMALALLVVLVVIRPLTPGPALARIRERVRVA